MSAKNHAFHCAIILELIFVWFWLAFAMSSPNAEEVYIRLFGFDARGVVIAIYLASVCLRFIATYKMMRKLGLLGVTLLAAAGVISVIAAQHIYP